LRFAKRVRYVFGMRFNPPLIPGVLVQRYKRFLADVTLVDGTAITSTCPNTGTMMGLTAPGSRVWLSTSDSPTRKYKHTLEIVEADGGMGLTPVGVNTNHPNPLVNEAINNKNIPELAGYTSLRREMKYGVNSRIDIFLQGHKKKPDCYVEIKNVHLVRSRGLAEFPDCKTERGVKHLSELSAMVAAGSRAVMLYLVQRSDVETFAIAADLDAAYAKAFAGAKKAGVEMICYACDVAPAGITVARKIKISGR
jgi:sugar fermentation stimulation protein A